MRGAPTCFGFFNHNQGATIYQLPDDGCKNPKHVRALSRNTNKMQLCNIIYYSKVY